MALADMQTFFRTGFLNLPIMSSTLIFRSLIYKAAEVRRKHGVKMRVRLRVMSLVLFFYLEPL